MVVWAFSHAPQNHCGGRWNKWSQPKWTIHPQLFWHCAGQQGTRRSLTTRQRQQGTVLIPLLKGRMTSRSMNRSITARKHAEEPTQLTLHGTERADPTTSKISTCLRWLQRSTHSKPIPTTQVRVRKNYILNIKIFKAWKIHWSTQNNDCIDEWLST